MTFGPVYGLCVERKSQLLEAGVYARSTSFRKRASTPNTGGVEKEHMHLRIILWQRGIVYIETYTRGDVIPCARRGILYESPASSP